MIKKQTKQKKKMSLEGGMALEPGCAWKTRLGSGSHRPKSRIKQAGGCAQSEMVMSNSRLSLTHTPNIQFHTWTKDSVNTTNSPINNRPV